MIKKIFAAVLCAALLVTTLTACGKQELLEKQNVNYASNYEALEAGDKIAVITVKDYGTIKIHLFPEYAPKAVENFIGLAEMGYYDELIFHRIIESFVIQGGDPKGDGTGGNSIWGGDFDLESTPSLYHFTGAVAYAHAQNGGNGSQFYIVNTPEGMSYDGAQATPITDEVMSNFSYTSDINELYKEKGGLPFLDGGYTVFGQVIEGMDVVYAISAVDTNSSDMPTKQVVIEKVEIIEYQGE